MYYVQGLLWYRHKYFTVIDIKYLSQDVIFYKFTYLHLPSNKMYKGTNFLLIHKCILLLYMLYKNYIITRLNKYIKYVDMKNIIFK